METPTTTTTQLQKYTYNEVKLDTNFEDQNKYTFRIDDVKVVKNKYDRPSEKTICFKYDNPISNEIYYKFKGLCDYLQKLHPGYEVVNPLKDISRMFIITGKYLSP